MQEEPARIERSLELNAKPVPALALEPGGCGKFPGNGGGGPVTVPGSGPAGSSSSQRHRAARTSTRERIPRTQKSPMRTHLWIREVLDHRLEFLFRNMQVIFTVAPAQRSWVRNPPIRAARRAGKYPLWLSGVIQNLNSVTIWFRNDTSPEVKTTPSTRISTSRMMTGTFIVSGVR